MQFIYQIFKKYEALSKEDSEKREQNKANTTVEKAQPPLEKATASKDTPPPPSTHSLQSGMCI